MKRTLTSLLFALSLLMCGIQSTWAQDVYAGMRAYERGDFSTAIKIWTPYADSGNPAVMNNLALALLNRRSSNQDIKEALILLKRAARKGLAGGKAETTIGWHYFKGDYAPEIPQKYAKSLYWNNLGAKNGNPNAHSNLALHYFGGFGVDQDFKKMVFHLIRAIELFDVSFEWVTDTPDEWIEYKQMAPGAFWDARRLYWRAISTGERSHYNELKKIYSKLATPEDPQLRGKRDPNEIIPASSGSGFSISSTGHVITNYHVVEGCQKIKIHLSSETVHADLITYDPQNDVALLKGEFRPSTVFSLSTDGPELLQDIYVAGFPFGRRVSESVKVTKGIISALTGINNNFSNIQIDAALQPGNSGGPIMDDKGNVVGVAVSRLDKIRVFEKFGSIPENTNFGIKSSVIKSILDSQGIPPLKPRNTSISKTALGSLIADGTYYLSCWMTYAQIEGLKSKKVIFQGLE